MSEHYRSGEFYASAEQGCGMAIIIAVPVSIAFYGLLYWLFGWVAVVGVAAATIIAALSAAFVLRK